MTERTGSNGKGLGESRNGETNGTDSFRLSEIWENFKLGQIVAINWYVSVRPYLISVFSRRRLKILTGCLLHMRSKFVL